MTVDTSAKERIGFVGAGMMGSGMCANLMKAGHPLTVIAHRNRDRIEALIRDGAKEANSLTELAAQSDVIMICVNSADTVRSLVNTIEPDLRPGMMIVDITTSLPEVSRELAHNLASRDVAFVDAPVVGGPAQAGSGELGTFLGGPQAYVDRARQIVSAYSVDVEHFGDTGAGNVAKLINNFLTVGLRQLVVQAFRSARRNDIAFEKLYPLVAKGAAGSRTLDQFVQGALVGDYGRNKFSIANCYKDMSYAEALFADDPDGAAIQQVMKSAYDRLMQAGLGDRLASEMLDPDVEALVNRDDT